jgi:O-antigen/teichoic acid export membrane protein
VLQAGQRTVSWPILAWGAGALAGALLGCWSWSVRPRLRDGWHLLREQWPSGRWLLTDFATTFSADQLYVVVVALLVSDVDYGRYRAALLLLGPVIVLLLAAGNIALPEMSRRWRGLDGSAGGFDAISPYVRKTSRTIATAVAIYGLVVGVIGGTVLAMVIGEDFDPDPVIAVLVTIGYVAAAASFGRGQALKVMGRMRELWVPRLCVGVVALVSVAVFESAFGIRGVGLAGLGGGGGSVPAVHLTHYSALRGASVSAGSPGVAPSALPAAPQSPASAAQVHGRVRSHDVVAPHMGQDMGRTP